MGEPKRGKQFQPWLPMETAPRDGTTILAWGPFIGHHVVEYDDSVPDLDFPWATLDGPCYFAVGIPTHVGFLCQHRQTLNLLRSRIELNHLNA
jgi:hypothetical protein